MNVWLIYLFWCVLELDTKFIKELRSDDLLGDELNSHKLIKRDMHKICENIWNLGQASLFSRSTKKNMSTTADCNVQIVCRVKYSEAIINKLTV